MASDERKPIWDHIVELSERLKIILYSIVFFTIVMMVVPADLSFLENPLDFYNPLIGRILYEIRRQVLPPGMRLIGLEVTQPIELYVVSSFIFGIILSMPIIGYEIYKFINPALYPHERRAVWGFMGAFLALFTVGTLFGYFILVKFLLWAMMPFFELTGAEPIISVMDFYNLVFITVLMTGLTFTAPAVFTLLVKIGLISTKAFTRNRRYIYAGIFIFTAILTPDGGPIADIALFLPIIILMEGAVFFAKRYERQRAAKLEIPTIPTIKCPHCGAEISAGRLFCPECGKALD